MPALDILIAPISGGSFGNQLHAGCILSGHNYDPDVVMGASGGAVAVTILAASDFKQRKILYNSSFCSSAMFIEKWVEFIPPWVIGFFQGSLYKHSGRHSNLFEQIMPSKILKEKEIWILTYNINKTKSSLFCSSSCDTTLMSPETNKDYLIELAQDLLAFEKGDECFAYYCNGHKSVEINEYIVTYLEGDVKMFGDAVLASASIPTVTPPVQFGSTYHADGGVYYASPLIPMQEDIMKNESFHIVYVHGRNIMKMDNKLDFDPTCGSILKSAGYATHSIIRSHIISDRRMLHHLIKQVNDRNKDYVSVIGEHIKIGDYMDNKSKWVASVLELYPEDETTLDISNFTSEELLEVINSNPDNIKGLVSYVIIK